MDIVDEQNHKTKNNLKKQLQNNSYQEEEERKVGSAQQTKPIAIDFSIYIKRAQKKYIEPFLVYQRLTIYDTDYNRLDPYSWLNDKIIDFFIEFLIELSAYREKNPNIAKNRMINDHDKILCSYCFSSLDKYEYDKNIFDLITPQEYFRINKRQSILEFYDSVFLVVNEANYHWILIEISLQTTQTECIQQQNKFNDNSQQLSDKDSSFLPISSNQNTNIQNQKPIQFIQNQVLQNDNPITNENPTSNLNPIQQNLNPILPNQNPLSSKKNIISQKKNTTNTQKQKGDKSMKNLEQYNSSVINKQNTSNIDVEQDVQNKNQLQASSNQSKQSKSMKQNITNQNEWNNKLNNNDTKDLIQKRRRIEMRVYNSLGKSNIDNSTAVILLKKYFQNDFSEIYGDKDILEFNLISEKVPTQSGGPDCGVFCCKYLQKLFYEKQRVFNYEQFTSSKINDYRKLIQQIILDVKNANQDYSAVYEKYVGLNV